jgi:phenylalanine-4-hydroxylase
VYTLDAATLRSDMQLSAPEAVLDLLTYPVPQYSDVEHQTWATLIANQKAVLPGRLCQAFLDGIDLVGFPCDRIPSLLEISNKVEALSGWKLTRVAGIVPDEDFFKLLSQRIFPSTDFIRKPDEIGYTPAPDMFHDLMGHVPLLVNPRFADFFEAFGRAGVRAFELDHPAKVWLARLYWYTVEFGLIQEKDGLHIFGAGIASSPKEVMFSLSEETRKHAFDIEQVAATAYDIWHMQEDLFVIESFDALEKEFLQWTAKHGLN